MEIHILLETSLTASFIGGTKVNSSSPPPDSPGSSFWVEALTTTDYASHTLWTKHSSSWLPKGFWTRWLLSTATPYTPIEHLTLAAYWALLETEALTGMENVFSYVPVVPIMLWIRDVSQQQLSTTISTSLLNENGT